MEMKNDFDEHYPVCCEKIKQNVGNGRLHPVY